MSAAIADLHREAQRKLIHLSSLWIVACIYWLSWRQATVLFFLFFVVLLCYDWLRYKQWLPNFIASVIQNILRPKEVSGFRLTGASWMMLAAFLCILLFDRHIAFAAMLVLIVSDACAALVGKACGSVPILDKSLQGSLAFAVSAWLSLVFTSKLFLLDDAYSASILPAAVATLVEMISGKMGIDDNLSIPLSLAIVLSLLA